MATGEVLLLRGPNGAGKTTLLRLLAGLATLDAGQGEVLGCDLRRDRRALRAQVGLLAHDLMLYEDLTVLENLRFWAALAGASPAESRAALARLQVAPRLWDVPLRRLSTGQRKRVATVALAVRRPRLWLLDEPHAGLDDEGRGAVNDLLLDAARSGATVLLASHDAPAATEVAGRTVHLAGGIVRTSPQAAQFPASGERPDA